MAAVLQPDGGPTAIVLGGHGVTQKSWYFLCPKSEANPSMTLHRVCCEASLATVEGTTQEVGKRQ